jgi:hypothetical protein
MQWGKSYVAEKRVYPVFEVFPIGIVCLSNRFFFQIFSPFKVCLAVSFYRSLIGAGICGGMFLGGTMGFCSLTVFLPCWWFMLMWLFNSFFASISVGNVCFQLHIGQLASHFPSSCCFAKKHHYPVEQ